MKRYCLADLVCPLSGEPLQIIAIKEKPLNLSAPDKTLLARQGIAEQDAMSAVEEGILYAERGATGIRSSILSPCFSIFRLISMPIFANAIALTIRS